jgi:hypothetical protein
MRTVRRWYVYVLAYASLIALSAGVINLAQTLVRYALGLGFDRNAFALWAGVLVVALPIHLGHALWANRQARQDAEERGAVLRKAYTYAVAALGALLIATQGHDLLRQTVRVVLAAPVRHPDVWWAEVLSRLFAILWSGLLLWYALLLVRLDGDYAREPGRAATWRRLFAFAVGGVGLLLTVSALMRLFTLVLLVSVPPQPPSGLVLGTWWRRPLTDAIATVLVGGLFWRWAWSTMRGWGALPLAERERYTLSRQAFYYVGVTVGVGVSLAALAYLLRQGLLGLLGEPLGPRHEWWPSIAWALGALPVGLVTWRQYRAQVFSEQAAADEPWFHLVVGRLYTYVVSAVGLGLLWFGAIAVLQVLTTQALLPPRPGLNPTWWREPLATGLALLAVGGPVWWWHWQRIQDVARQPGRAGQRERASVLRKLYLYGVSLAAGLIVLVTLAQVAYQGWLWILGEPVVRLLEQLVDALAPALTAGTGWAFHARMLRWDTRLQREAGVPEEEEDMRAALLAERERLLQRLAEVEQRLRELEGQRPDEG